MSAVGYDGHLSAAQSYSGCAGVSFGTRNLDKSINRITEKSQHAPFERPFLETALALLAYDPESVALPSVSGGHFMSSGLHQRLGKRAMPGAH